MCALSVSHVFSPDCSFATTLSSGWTKSEATIHWDLIRYFISEVSVDRLHLSGSKAEHALCLIKMAQAVFPVQKPEHCSEHHPTWSGGAA